MKIVVTKGTYKPDGVTLAQMEEFEQEHLNWLSDRICKNCQWWAQQSEYSNTEWDCWNDTVGEFVWLSAEGDARGGFKPNENFGCNQWEKKG